MFQMRGLFKQLVTLLSFCTWFLWLGVMSYVCSLVTLMHFGLDLAPDLPSAFQLPP